MAGALTRYADKVRRAGRHGDTELVHMNREELEGLRQSWGEPTINPDTGLPEYFLGGILSSILPALLPIAGDYLFPEAISGIADYLGVGEGLVRGVGGGLLGAASSAATGGSPLMGGLLGGASGYFAPDALKAIGLGSGTSMSGTPKYDSIDQLLDKLGKDGTLGGGGTGLGGVAKSSSMTPALIAAGLLTALSGGNKSQTPAVPVPTNANSGYQLPKYPDGGFRKYVAQVNPDYTKPGAKSYFETNALPAAHGAHVDGRGSGRDDTVPAMLSDGEYVVDAETVSMLGDGSNDAGAKQLDTMRNNLRRHKGRALADGKFSPNARPPEGYMSRGAA